MDHGKILLDEIHSHRRVMQSVVNRLAAISDTLDEVGMTKMAERVFAEAQLVRESAEAVFAAYDNNLSAEWAETQGRIGNILTALLDNCDNASQKNLRGVEAEAKR